MSKKMPPMTQHTFDFERPPADEPKHVATTTSKPPPATPDLLLELPKAPYSFDEFKNFFRELQQGTLTFKEYREQFERLLVSEDAVRSELRSRFKAKQLAVLASRMGSWNARGQTKDENTRDIYRRMMSGFLLDSAVVYSMGERYEDALRDKVLAVTENDFQAELEKRAGKAREHNKALANPKTFLEFRTFLQSKGEGDLTDEQLERYDTLHAESTRERRQTEVTKTVERFQSDELSGYQFTIQEGFHERRQCPLWIVSLQSRVERPTFNELNIKAKMLGGWYSSFKRDQAGFQFTSNDQADRFASLLSADADRSDVLASRKDRKEQSAAERLHELADSIAVRADETISQSNDSLQNTARRADIQAGVRGRAYKELALSRSMHSIAEALSRGEAKFLEGIRHRTQIETLDSILHLAKWARTRANRSTDSRTRTEHDDEQRVSAADIRYAEFPYPTVYKRHIEEAIAKCRSAKGARMASERMAKRIRREKEEYVTFKDEGDIKGLEDFLGRAKVAGHATEWMESAIERHRRLLRAGIFDIHELRGALREYLPHLAEIRGDDPVKVAERELIGKKLPGFFPTPPSVIEEMLSLAAIEHHHRVLEPSCGKGDILDALRAEHPDASIVAIEQNYSLQDVLSAKGYEVQFTDFLSHRGTYDRILMNPPFENGQDIDHVRHAFEQLAAGGRLVSVMSEGPFFRQDKKAVAFRDWLLENAAATQQLPEDAFQGAEAFRQTGVRTRLVVIERANVV